MSASQMDFSENLKLDHLSKNLSHAVRQLRNGQPILLLDDSDRENEGDLVVAAEKITPSVMNYLIKKSSGVVCLSMTKERLNHLEIPMMMPQNTNQFQTAFTVSIEARYGVSTGVSAADRCHTILQAVASDAKPSDLARPGHVFPLAAEKNGLFDRAGHTEGSVDLMKIAGLKPAAVLCELMNDDGSMTKGDERIVFAQNNSIPIVTNEEILFHRIRFENIFTLEEKSLGKTQFGMVSKRKFSFDDIDIEVFQSLGFNAKDKHVRAAFCSIDDTRNRYFAQLFTQADDDPLKHYLTQLENNSLDLVICAFAKTNSKASKRKIHAAKISRVLSEIGPKTISCQEICPHFKRIANNFFSLNIE